MNIIHKTYKYRLYPNKKQRALLQQHFGATRFVWNYFLSERKRSYLEDKKSLTFYDNSKALTLLKQSEKYSWLKEVSSISLQASLQDLDTAYGRFFQKKSKFPKFKSEKNPKQSFRCRQSVSIKDNKLCFPKFQTGVKLKQNQVFSGSIRFVTISKTATGKYFASMTCIVEHQPMNFLARKQRIGVDLGIKTLMTCSNGQKVPNSKEYKAAEKNLAYEQRQLSKKQKGSNARNKQRKKVALVHEKISCKRKDYIHKATAKLVQQSIIIVVENLNVKGMVKNRNLAKHISDANWSTIIDQLRYKSEWNDRVFVQVDRFFPSSKTCSKCFFIKQSLSLNEREWSCPSCGATHDRDVNASKNILKQGLKILSGCGTQSDIKQKSVEASGS